MRRDPRPRIHALDPGPAAPLKERWARQQIDGLAANYQSERWPRPVFALAFRWLYERAPPPLPTPRLVHGDFRNGNLIVGPQGLRAVLDWELAHLGDPWRTWAGSASLWRFGGTICRRRLRHPRGFFAGYVKRRWCGLDPRVYIFGKCSAP